MDSTKRVELVRIEREEQVFAREDVVGRDASSVFPTETKKAEVDARTQAFKALFGDNRRFVTETELRDFEDAALKRSMPEDTGPSRPLAEILQEAKDAKDQKFKDTWKQMKIGKNRPLDEDELEFLDSLAEEEASKRRKLATEEALEAETYRRMREQQEVRQERGAGPAGPQPAAPSAPAPAPQRKRQPKLAVRAVVRAVADKNDKTETPDGTHPDNMVMSSRTGLASGAPAAAATTDATSADTTPVRDEEDEPCAPAHGLGDLLGAYSSDSD